MKFLGDVASLVAAFSFELVNSSGETVMTLTDGVPFPGYSALEMHHLDPDVGDSVIAWSVGDSATDDQTTLIRGPLGPGYTAPGELQWDTGQNQARVELSPGTADLGGQGRPELVMTADRQVGLASVSLLADSLVPASGIAQILMLAGVGLGQTGTIELIADTVPRSGSVGGPGLGNVYGRVQGTSAGSLGSPIGAFANMVVVNFSTHKANSIIALDGAINWLATAAGTYNIQGRFAVDGAPTTAMLLVAGGAGAALNDRMAMAVPRVFLVVPASGAHVAGLQVAKAGGAATWSASGYLSWCVLE